MAVTETAFKYIDGQGALQNSPVWVDALGYYVPISSPDSPIAHFRAAFSALTPVTTPTVFAQMAGSATKTVRIKRIGISGASTAGVGSMPLTIEKCSAIPFTAGAVLTTVTSVPSDSNSAAGTAIFSTVGTANYATVPTVVGAIATARVPFAELTAATTAGAGAAPLTQLVFEFGTNGTQALVLRGVAQTVTLSFKNTAVLAGGVVDGWIEYCEDGS